MEHKRAAPKVAEAEAVEADIIMADVREDVEEDVMMADVGVLEEATSDHASEGEIKKPIPKRAHSVDNSSRLNKRRRQETTPKESLEIRPNLKKREASPNPVGGERLSKRSRDESTEPDQTQLLTEMEGKIQKLKVIAEETRIPGSRPVTFLVKHARQPSNFGGSHQDKGYVFFYSASRRYGGPFNFLSNLHKSQFTVADMAGDFLFKSMEQFYQFCKASCFDLCSDEFIVTLPGNVKVSSHRVSQLVMEMDSPIRTANFVRQFVEAGRAQSERWYQEWFQVWSMGVLDFLKVGLEAKFRDNHDLKEALMLTGDYELVEASPHDSNCGVGFPAAKAFDNRDEWESDPTRNLLGQALMRLRREIYAQSGGLQWPQRFDRKHYSMEEWKFWSAVVKAQRGDDEAKGKERAATTKKKS